MRYRIIYQNETGHSSSKILATALEGELLEYANNFDGRGNHLALIEFPSEKQDHADAMLDKDNSVISYRNTRYV